MSSESPTPVMTVAAFYQFAAFPDFEIQQPLIQEFCDSQGIKGTILVAAEGLNGTIAGPKEGIEAVLDFLRTAEPFTGRFAGITAKYSQATFQPFNRMKVRLKKEIVSMGVTEVDPTAVVGTYVKPKDWNELISDPEVIVIDTRNKYEVDIGTFKGAVNPETDSFREFPAYVADNLNPEIHRKVAMFCTGGIRCEKATSFLCANGFDEVYHLEGGILKYLEDVPEKESLWEGECFVFDNRVAVNHDLERGQYEMCHACRHPITDADMESPAYVKGIACPHCHDQTSEERKAAFAMRERQLELERARAEDGSQ